MEALLGEGMPWRILMVFFAIGAWYGLKAERKSRFLAENAENTEGGEALDYGDNAAAKAKDI